MEKRMHFHRPPSETAVESFARFLRTKRTVGAKTKTIETYTQHFHAIARHLDVAKDIGALTSGELQQMIESMRNSGLSPNSIKSYTIT
ncbi:MAG: hypothetical protein IJC93_09780 [Clostridia bacterium]|nr:hypothetical protein [Clostridia bacterium]